jgi:hypothetical protein
MPLVRLVGTLLVGPAMKWWLIVLVVLAVLAMLAASRGQLPVWLTSLPHAVYDTDQQHRRNGEL